MKNDPKNRADKNTNAAPAYRNGLAYLLIGGGIGATLALLFAPKSGSQIRSDIANASRKGYEAAAEKARVVNERSGEIVKAVKDKAGSVYEFAKGQSDTANTPMEPGTGSASINTEVVKGIGRASIG